MKINHEDLKRIYKDFVNEKVPKSRKNCPTPEEIVNFFRSKVSDKQKTKIIDHISHYSYCAQEFEFTFQTSRGEKKLIEEIGNVLQAERAVSIPKTRRKIFSPLLSWKYAAQIIGAVIIISAFIVFLNLEKREYRGTHLSQVEVIGPSDGRYSRASLLFKWNEFKDSEYYILELFNETLYPVWKSDKIYENQANLPDKIAKGLKEDKTYFWMITAFLSTGRKIESRLEKFKLIR